MSKANARIYLEGNQIILSSFAKKLVLYKKASWYLVDDGWVELTFKSNVPPEKLFSKDDAFETDGLSGGSLTSIRALLRASAADGVILWWAGDERLSVYPIEKGVIGEPTEIFVKIVSPDELTEAIGRAGTLEERYSTLTEVCANDWNAISPSFEEFCSAVEFGSDLELVGLDVLFAHTLKRRDGSPLLSMKD